MIHEDENLDKDGGLFTGSDGDNDDQGRTTVLGGMYKDWFLDYASYVILERAVPSVVDGLKPVQRRILHSMRELEDGRYNKVANLIGHTMKYHPHGDASIGDALVQIGQKDLLIDTQGNWGNILTGDSAAAARYIEARLTKFALDVVFNPKTTQWQASYDGRNKEPINLPAKFPLLLAQGGEGIAVGLSCKVLPHNFLELIDACVDYLKGKKFEIYPDFPTGGSADFSNYNDGMRGGRVRCRAKIRMASGKQLIIDEIPFGTTTSSLIDSIIKANEKGKIKVKKIEDNTAEKVEIVIHLHPEASPDKTIDALYAFTDCEISIAPNACVIENDKPRYLGVSEILRISADNTVELHKLELNIRLSELESMWHFASLEKIFIENKIYRKIENEETWDGVIKAIDKGLKPFTANLKRGVTQDDIVKLTEIKIKRISKFDSDKADHYIESLEEEIQMVRHNLKHVVNYTIDFYKNIRKKYGTGKERKTEPRIFDTIEAVKVVATNTKLYANRSEGFIGTSLKKDEFICDCSDIDDIIVFREDGRMIVSRISDKKFVGKGIIHIAVWKKGDKNRIYHLVYRDGKQGAAFAKRFAVTAITRDKEYILTRGNPESKVLYFTEHPNGEAEIITVHLRARPNLKRLTFDYEMAGLAVKNMQSQGNLLTKYSVNKISQKEIGGSTLQAQQIWFDDITMRLNISGRGELLGRFRNDDKILTATQSGYYRISGHSLDLHFDDDLIMIEKLNMKRPVTIVYYDGDKEAYFVKRFMLDEGDRKNHVISISEGSRIELITTQWVPRIKVEYDGRSTSKKPENINLSKLVEVRNEKAVGNKLTEFKIKQITLLDPKKDDIPEDERENEAQLLADRTDNLEFDSKGGGDGEQMGLF
ncbi:MAG TPA: DNA gyrase/topoisomerase IV subunit A [Flavobacteriales bacterium]|nr:DNA gyrase/topoisomerase IV subunit A [Flavobacteriales bacterium]